MTLYVSLSMHFSESHVFSKYLYMYMNTCMYVCTPAYMYVFASVEYLVPPAV